MTLQYNNICLKLFCLYAFLSYILTILGHISSNVPAVCDGFAVAIKEREAFQQPQNCGVAKLHKGRKPDWSFAEPEPPTGGEAHTDLLYAVFAIF